jgi:hypothetical protein
MPSASGPALVTPVDPDSPNHRPALSPTPDRTDGGNEFADAWGGALISGRPRLHLPRAGLRGLALIGTSAAAVIALTWGALAVPSLLPDSLLGRSEPDHVNVARAANETPDRAGPSTPAATKEATEPPPAPGRAGTQPDTVDPFVDNGGRSQGAAGSGSGSAGSPARVAATGKPTTAAGKPATVAKPAATQAGSGSVKTAATKPKVGLLSGGDYPSDRTLTVRSRMNGNYVRTEVNYTGNKKGMLRAVSSSVADWEKFVLRWNSGRKAWTLQSAYTKAYVSSEVLDGGNTEGMLRARAASPSDWEMFKLYRLSDGAYAFRSVQSGGYVSAEVNDGGETYGMLRARAGSVSGWERFTLP